MRGLGRLAALAAFVLVVLAAAGALWFRAAAVVDRSVPVAETDVVVPAGSTASEIAVQLASERVIRSPLVFSLLARAKRLESRIQAGEYRFAAHQTTSEILQRLVTGGQQVAVWVTIPEGFTSKEIAARLEEGGVGNGGVFQRYFLHESIVLDGTRTASLEGFLFPDTYLIPLGASPQAVAQILSDQLRRELPPDAAARAKHLGLTVPQVVTVASLVEREAKSDDERALMAGVYYNRLRLGMPLEVDATIEYTFAHHKDVITLDDLARDSPYNTYEHTGLPPTPIASPGQPSLQAAFHPQASDYLYYVYMGNGHHAFSRTLAEHNANVARYLR
ncbi:MAG: endolytic transglycosylase MltG [Vulcanimicrobiaceae bacterium]